LRPSDNGIPLGFYCYKHRESTDEVVPESYAIHRVSVVAEITFAGTSFVSTAAKAEALERLSRAVAEAGGTLNLHSITSQTGHYEPPAAGRRRKGNGSGGQ
jgi:hypothetical protein